VLLSTTPKLDKAQLSLLAFLIHFTICSPSLRNEFVYSATWFVSVVRSSFFLFLTVYIQSSLGLEIDYHADAPGDEEVLGEVFTEFEQIHNLIEEIYRVVYDAVSEQEEQKTSVDELQVALKQTIVDLRSLETAVSQPIYLYLANKKKSLREKKFFLENSTDEHSIRLSVSEPTIISFPENILGISFGLRELSWNMLSQNTVLITPTSKQDLKNGIPFFVRTASGVFYGFRAILADKKHPRDVSVRIS
jgi:predicted small metal-binding protein